MSIDDAPSAQAIDPDRTSLLRCRGMTKSFGGPPVLDGVDFDVFAGEVHVLAGENGAGKSTLMRIACGVLAPDAGRFEGQVVDASTGKRAVGDPVAMIHQELSLAPSLSVLDNLFLGREPVGFLGRINRSEERDRGRAVLLRVGLDIPPSTRVGALPLGVRQLVEIAKALLRDAAVLVMDEPTSALSRPEVLRLFDLMREIVRDSSRPTGIVYISHRLEEIYAIADRITVLRDGKAIVTAPAAGLSASALIHAMVGREIDESTRRERSALPPGPPPTDTLAVRDLCVRGETTLDGISLSVAPGEILGIGGLQGSGAGTLLKALFARTPEATIVAGDVQFGGQPLDITTPSAAMARGIAYLPEDRGTSALCRGLSTADNLSLASLDRLAPSGWIRRDRVSRWADQAVQRFGVRCNGPEQVVATLSGGNQQKVALGKWLARDPKLLLLHEPTRGVDIGARQEIYRLINLATARGAAVLLVSTDLNELLGLSDRLVVLHRGRIAAEWSAADATPHAVIAAALGEPIGACA
jgi:ribose transport system ATP-binding protein